ncbi:hypothetical protein [Allokutzneria sp. NRRL B-24872]|uniref:hypothetical protein n=1 Tax=Allokutzneria sp. NRRL B-24872 TaxID=1137961 RepID=UPI000A37656E|nr:hypothetical protein [Allokutzneria sp. NRRL B-24872]
MGDTRTRALVSAVGISATGVSAVVLFSASWTGNEVVRWLTIGLALLATGLVWVFPKAAAGVFGTALLISGYTVLVPHVPSDLTALLLGTGRQEPLQLAGWLLLIAPIVLLVRARPVPVVVPFAALAAALLLGWGWSALLMRGTDESRINHTTTAAKPATGQTAEWIRTMRPGLYGNGVLVPGRGVVVELRDSAQSTQPDQGLFVAEAASGKVLWQFALSEKYHLTQVVVDPGEGVLFARIRRAGLFFDLMTGELRHRMDLAELQPDSTFHLVRDAGDSRPPIRIGQVALLNASRPGMRDDVVFVLDIRTRAWREVLRGANPNCGDHWVSGVGGAENYFVRNNCTDATVHVIRLDGLRETAMAKFPVRQDDRRCKTTCALLDVVALDGGLLLHTSDSGETAAKGEQNHGLIWLRRDGTVGDRASFAPFTNLTPLQDRDGSRSRVAVPDTAVLDFRSGTMTREDVRIAGNVLGGAPGVVYLDGQKSLRALDVRTLAPRGADAPLSCAPRFASATEQQVLVNCKSPHGGDIALVVLPAR